MTSLKGDGLRARTLRALGASSIGFGGEMALRLASNIILASLLFPEAFGLMLIVSVVTTGASMFSDVGIKSSIIRSPRGDDEVFLNTAWTLQILRGFAICAVIMAAAWPVSRIYGEPALFGLLLLVSLNPIMVGFSSTSLASEERHLRQTKLTIILIASRAFAVIVTVALAFWLRSVWALAIGSLTGPLCTLIASHVYISGIRNRLCLERDAVWEIFSFGKFIFLSTLCSFMITQGDKALLGGFVSLGLVGIYNIAWGLGTLPQLLMRMFTRKVVYPLYRMRPPDQSEENRRQLFKARRMLVTALLGLNAVFAFLSVWIVDLLYSDTYALAAPMMALISLSAVPIIVLEGYVNALLSYGDSRRVFMLSLATAIVQTGLLLIGLTTIGLVGGIVAPGLAAICTYPLLARFVRRYKALDMVADIVLAAAGLAVIMGVLAFHGQEVLALFGAE